MRKPEPPSVADGCSPNTRNRRSIPLSRKSSPTLWRAARPSCRTYGTETMTLKHVVVAFESEQSARERLESFGYERDVAAEIAVYLAQSTDLPQFTGEIARAF